jgi:hypothetical protein
MLMLMRALSLARYLRASRRATRGGQRRGSQQPGAANARQQDAAPRDAAGPFLSGVIRGWNLWILF